MLAERVAVPQTIRATPWRQSAYPAHWFSSATGKFEARGGPCRCPSQVFEQQMTALFEGHWQSCPRPTIDTRERLAPE